MLNIRQPDLDTDTATQAVEFVYGNLLEVSRIQMIFPLIVGYVFWGTVATWKIVLWCAASCLIYLARIVLTLQYRKRPPTEVNPAKWGRLFTATSLVSGVMWGYAAWLFYVPEAQTALVLLYVLIVGTAAGAVMISSYGMPGYLAYAIPSVLLTVLSLFFNGDHNENVLGFMMCLLLLMLLSVAYKCRKQAYESIRLRFENLDLIDRLAVAKERAEDASRAKTQFLASANHDLRQPVHALSLLSYSLKEELTTERGKTVYGQLDQTVSNLNSLLESLLDLSQLDSGALQVKPTSIYLPELAEQLRSEFLSLCGQKGLAFRVKSLDATIHTDGTLLLRLLRNLLTNAVRYTRSGGVLLAFRSQGNQVAIQIWDTGIGIKEEDQHNVFREFFQVGNKARNSNEGLGLGLAICQKIIELLELELSMKSVFGRGTVFTVTL
ncbi:MAG: HAMP domain-containing sensor histidine kinase, partial [Pseudomonadota bacterium]